MASINQIIDRILERFGYIQKKSIGMDVSAFNVNYEYEKQEDYLAAETAFQSSNWVHRCTNTIAHTLGSLPVKLVRDTGDGIEEIQGHYILDILQAPSRLKGYAEFWEDVFGYYVLTGNQYTYIQYGNARVPSELICLRSSRMKVRGDEKYGIGGYIEDFGNGKRNVYDIRYNNTTGQPIIQPGNPYDGSKIIHLKSFNPVNDFYGMSRITPNTMNINTDLAARKYIKAILKNGGVIGAVFEAEGKQPPEAEERRMRESLEKMFKGAENAGKMAIAWGGAKYKPMGQTPRAMDHAQLTDRMREEIAAGFEIPPSIVGLYQYANYANAEVQSKDFWIYTGIPMLGIIDEGFNRGLIQRHFPKEWEQGYYLLHDVSGVEVLQEDKAQRSTIIAQQWTSGIVTRNEARVKLGYEKVPDGEVFYQDVSRSSFGEYGNLSAPKIKIRELSQGKNINPKWQAYERKLSAYESDFATDIRGYFRKQKERLLEKLEKDISIPRNIRELSDWFDWEEELREMWNALTPSMENIYGRIGDSELDDLGIKLQFDMENPKVRDFLRLKYNTAFPNITETTRKTMEDILAKASTEGWTMNQIQDEIASTFNNWILGEPNTLSRSLRIARTEMNGVMQSATNEAWEQSDVVKGGVWMVADSDAREAHLAADGQFAELGQPFDVGGEALMFPGDPNGSAGNIINCRCGRNAVLKET